MASQSRGALEPDLQSPSDAAKIRELAKEAAGLWQQRKALEEKLREAILGYGGFLTWGVAPVIIHFDRILQYEPSILGIHHLWKPPYLS